MLFFLLHIVVKKGRSSILNDKKLYMRVSTHYFAISQVLCRVTYLMKQDSANKLFQVRGSTRCPYERKFGQITFQM